MVKIFKNNFRINKLKLSETAENFYLTLYFLILTLQQFEEKDFLDIKINWLIKIKGMI